MSARRAASASWRRTSRYRRRRVRRRVQNAAESHHGVGILLLYSRRVNGCRNENFACELAINTVLYMYLFGNSSFSQANLATFAVKACEGRLAETTNEQDGCRSRGTGSRRAAAPTAIDGRS